MVTRLVVRNRDMIYGIRAGAIGIVLMGVIFAGISFGDSVVTRMAFAIPFAAIGLFLFWRPGRACVIADARGVTIRNVFRTHRLGWSEIGSFEFVRHGLFPRIAIAELQTGSRVPIWAIQAPNPAFRPRTVAAQQQLVDQMNDMMLAARDRA